MRIKANIVLFFVALVWGSAFVAQRIAAGMGSVFIFNGIRFLLAALVLYPFVRKRKAILRPGQIRWMGIAGGILFIGSSLQQAGMQYTIAANAGFFTSLYVVFVPLVVFWGWRERPHWLIVAAILLAVVGAFFLSTGGKLTVIQIGDTLEMLGAFFWSLHVVLLGKYASRYSALTFSMGQFMVAGVLQLIFGLIFERSVSPDWGVLALAIGYAGIFSVALGYTFQVWAQKHTHPTDAALIMCLEAVFALIFGWLFLNEFLTSIQITGCFLIFAAVLLAQVKAPEISSLPDTA
ncbi:MAG: DMT family transporter [Anaerolineales bacterium]|nr:DMT family transporter [Anaerolineales bacterium]